MTIYLLLCFELMMLFCFGLIFCADGLLCCCADCGELQTFDDTWNKLRECEIVEYRIFIVFSIFRVPIMVMF